MVKEANSSSVFVVMNLVNAKLITTHAQKNVPYSVTKCHSQAADELHQQATYYTATYYFVDIMLGVRKQKGGYQIKI